MGACNDELYLDGKLSTADVKKRFEQYQEECADESGNSYSGRLNMCPGLTFTGKIFENERAAQEYVDAHAQKWDNALAVQYYAKGRAKAPASIEKLNLKLGQLRGQLSGCQNDIRIQVDTKLKEVEFIKCGTCKSRLDTRFRTRTLKCPVCEGSFASTALQSRRTKLEQKIREVETKIKEAYATAQAKHDKTTKGELKWFIYGICSS